MKYISEELNRVILDVDATNEILTLNATDFAFFRTDISRKRTRKKIYSDIPKLSEIKTVQFRKGSASMFYKKSFEAETFEEARFVNKNIPSLPSRRTQPIGLNTEKKKFVRSCYH